MSLAAVDMEKGGGCGLEKEPTQLERRIKMRGNEFAIDLRVVVDWERFRDGSVRVTANGW